MVVLCVVSFVCAKCSEVAAVKFFIAISHWNRQQCYTLEHETCIYSLKSVSGNLRLVGFKSNNVEIQKLSCVHWLLQPFSASVSMCASLKENPELGIIM